MSVNTRSTNRFSLAENELVAGVEGFKASCMKKGALLGIINSGCINFAKIEV